MAGRKTGNRRNKPKKGINRYDPARPDYKAVHGTGTSAVAAMRLMTAPSILLLAGAK